MNQVILQGTITSDAKERSTLTGKTVASFTVMTSYKLSDGHRSDHHRVTVWNPRITLTKGLQVLLTGSLQTRSWVDKKSNEKKYVTEVSAREIYKVTVSEDEEELPLIKGMKKSDNTSFDGLSW